MLWKVGKKELCSDIEPDFGPNRPGDIPHSNADISKARSKLGYEPTVMFEEGMKKLIQSLNNIG